MFEDKCGSRAPTDAAQETCVVDEVTCDVAATSEERSLAPGWPWTVALASRDWSCCRRC